MGKALNGISLSYMGMGEIESALDFANASIKSAREISDKKSELNSLINLGEINYCIGNNEEAMDIFMQSIELTNDISDVYYSGISNQYLGLLMLRNSNYHEAMKYFEPAGISWKNLKDPTHEIWTNSAWALTAQRAGEIRVAAREVLRAESILNENKPYKDYAASVYYNLYNYYMAIGDTSLAKKYLSNANDEIIKRLKYIDNPKNKNDFLNRIVEYNEIIDSYKKYFD
jgi:tetratricopeptide (TPR) repeat protein